MQDDIEHMKRCLYRQWYRQRNEPTTLDRRKTFNDLFKAKYGETLDEYHQRLAAEMRPELKASMDFYKKVGR